jgi:hypothetical protein
MATVLIIFGLLAAWVIGVFAAAAWLGRGVQRNL